MGNRFGKDRVPNCCCTYYFTCGNCLAARKPYFWTCDDGTVIIVPDTPRKEAN